MMDPIADLIGDYRGFAALQRDWLVARGGVRGAARSVRAVVDLARDEPVDQPGPSTGSGAMIIRTTRRSTALRMTLATPPSVMIVSTSSRSKT